MAFVFAAFMLVSQILTIYSLMMVSKRVRAIETKSENNNDLGLGNETNDIQSVESKEDNFRFHENVAKTNEYKLVILVFEL